MVSLYFFSYVVLSVWVYFNLTVAIIMDHFSATFVADDTEIN